MKACALLLCQPRTSLSHRLTPFRAVPAIGPLLHALIATLAHAIRPVLAFLASPHTIGPLYSASLGVPALNSPPLRALPLLRALSAFPAFHLPALDVPTFDLAALSALSCTPGAVSAVVAIPLHTFALYGSALSFGSGPLFTLNTFPLNAGLRPLAPFDARASLLPAACARLSLWCRSLATVLFGAIRRPLRQGQRCGAEHRRYGCCWNCNPHDDGTPCCERTCALDRSANVTPGATVPTINQE